MRGYSEFENEQGAEFKNDRREQKSAKGLRDPRRIAGQAVAAFALAATLCGAGFLYAGSDGQNQKNKQKAAENGSSTASMLPDSQAIDLLISQMLGAWQAGDAGALQKFYAD